MAESVSASGNQKSRLSGALASIGLERFGALFAVALGIAATRSGLIVANYGGYRQTDEGFFTEMPSLFGAAILCTIILILYLSKRQLSPKMLLGMMLACIILQSASLLALAYLSTLSTDTVTVRMACSVVQVVTAVMAMMFWVRKVYRSNTAIVIILAFLSIGISEIWIYFCSLFVQDVACLLATLSVLLQLPLLRALSAKGFKQQMRRIAAIGGLSLERSLFSDWRLLITTFVTVSLISLTLGMLRGYPNGVPIPFTETTRFLFMFLAVATMFGTVLLSFRLRFWALVVTIWVVIQSLICMAIVATAALPLQLEIGAIFTTTANAFLAAFVLYLSALMMATFSQRDPYVCAVIMATIWTLFRALARLAIIELPIFSENSILIISFVAILLLVSSQAFFVCFVILQVSKPVLPFLEFFNEMDKQDRSLEPLPQPSGGKRLRLPIRRGVQEIGERFLLTERETEVLTLYVQGLTQKRVGEELVISVDTVHAHMKNIYRKTNMHSRLDMLDYIESYIVSH